MAEEEREEVEGEARVLCAESQKRKLKRTANKKRGRSGRKGEKEREYK